MARVIPAAQKAMEALLPASIVLVEGRTFDAKPTNNGKHSFSARAEVVEPAELAGSSLFDSFVIGDDNDPEAMKEETWLNSFGAKRMTSMFDAGGYDIRGQDEEVLQSTYIGMRYLASVTLTKEPEIVAYGPNKGQPNAYAGTERNNVKRYWPVGEREPMVMPATAGMATAVHGSPAKATAAAAPTAAPKAAPAAAPAAPKAAAAAAPKAASAGNSGAGKAKPATPSGTIKCVVPNCGESVALSDFPAHVQAKHPDA
jgi:hypothetical protein